MLFLDSSHSSTLSTDIRVSRAGSQLKIHAISRVNEFSKNGSQNLGENPQKGSLFYQKSVKKTFFFTKKI